MLKAIISFALGLGARAGGSVKASITPTYISRFTFRTDVEDIKKNSLEPPHMYKCVTTLPFSAGNGAGKSTLLSIMGGKKMVPRNAVASERRFQAYAIILWRSLQDCKILGKPVFHDSTLNSDRMYCPGLMPFSNYT